MRGFLLSTFIFLSVFLNTSSFSATFLEGTLKGGRDVKGELIEIYSDRWFFEEDSSSVPRFVLLFQNVGGHFGFDFFPLKDFAKVKNLSSGKSQYKSLLKEKNLFFKNDLVANANILTGNEGHHKFEKMFGNFAWDIGVLDSTGSQFSNNGTSLENYYIFGREVVSPIKGIVVGKVDGQEDNAPDLSFSSSLEGKVNNYLTIRAFENIYLSIVHFKKNSIEVEVGETIEVGQSLGKVGNSGVSYLPHLHYTMYAYIPEYDRFISIPGFFEN